MSATVAERARMARNDSERKRKRGELAPLGINPETGKRFIGTGRYPTSGTSTRLLDKNEPMPGGGPLVQVPQSARAGKRAAGEDGGIRADL